MSKTVDERVVEMRFDNKDFEKNTAQSMSTLDKLKSKLNLDGASKGLESVGGAAKNCSANVSPLGNAVEAVKVKFSALEVVGMTALANITNSVVNSGKRLIDSFTLEPLRTGFNEYELKMNSVQTIMASTGEDIETVNGYLNELNKYSDDTIYSFKDMTSNIGKFTNAGVNLKDAVAAIKGISNEAAVSGANAEEASRAMYNFSQALSAGAVKLIDWKSIENANMATVEFKNQLLETALSLGTVTKEGDRYVSTTTDMSGKVSDAFDATHNFNDALSSQWMTTDVLTQTLAKYADETTEIGAKATKAATEIKTFSMMMDTLKEAAQSGWAQTWEIIFGNFEEGKKLWTYLGNMFGDMIGKSADARNALLADTLSSKWEVFAGKVKLAGVSLDDLKDKVSDVAKEHNIDIDAMIEEYGSLGEVVDQGVLSTDIFTEALSRMNAGSSEVVNATSDMTTEIEEFQKIVDDVWRGDFKNGQERIEALTTAGYDYASVQSLVNRTEDGHRLTLEDLNAEQIKSIALTSTMSDEQLESIGFTKDQISVLDELRSQTDETGKSIDDIIQSMTKPTGRVLLIESLKNVLDAIIKPLKSVKAALSDVFKIDSDDLYSVIEMVHDFTKTLIISDETAENVQRTFRGVFEVFKLVGTVVKAGVTIPLKILNAVIGSFGGNVLDLTGGLGDLVYNFGKWLESLGLINTVVTKVSDGIVWLIKGVSYLFNELKGLPVVDSIVSSLDNKFSTVKDAFLDFIDRIKSLEGGITFNNIGKILDDFFNNVVKKFVSFKSISSGFVSAWNGIKELFSELYSKIFPSFTDSATKTYAAASNLTYNMSTAANGVAPAAEKLTTSVSGVHTTLKTFVDWIKDKVANVNFGQILAIAFGGTFIAAAVKVFGIVNVLSGAIEKVGGLFGSLTGVVNTFKNSLEKTMKYIGKTMNNVAKSMKYKAIGEMVWDIAKAIALIAGAVFLLSKLDGDGLGIALGVLGAIVGSLVALVVIMSKYPVKDTIKVAGTITAMAVAVGILAVAMKVLAGIDFLSALGAVVLLGIIMAELTACVVIITALGESFDKGARIILAMSVSMLILAFAVGKLAKLDFVSATIAVGLLKKLMFAMTECLVVMQLAGSNATKGAAAILVLTIAMILMTTLIKIVSKFTLKEVATGIIVVGVLIGLTYVMTEFMKKMGQNGQYAAKAGLAMIGIAAAMVMMAVVIKVLSGMDVASIVKGELAIAGFAIICAGLIAITKFAGNNALKAAAVIGAFSMAMIAISVSMYVLSSLDSSGIKQALEILVAVSAMMAVLLAVSSKAGNAMGTLAGIAICIGAISASIALLSLVDPAGAAVGTACIAALLGVLSILVKSTKGVNKNAKAAMIVMAVIIAELAIVIGALSGLPIEKTLGVAAALSVMLLSIGASLKLISSMNKVAPKALVAVIAMGLIMAALSGILFMIQGLNSEGMLEKCLGLSVMLLAIAESVKILSNVQKVETEAMLAVMVLEILMIGLVGIMYLLGQVDSAPSIEAVAGMSLMLIAMSAAVLILSKIGPAAKFALEGVGVLLVLIGSIFGVMVALGALNDWSKGKAKEFLEEGLPMLNLIGKGLGEFVGNIIGGVLSGIVQGLAGVGTGLSQFMDNMQPFLEDIKGIDNASVEGAKNLAELILMLTASDLLAKLTNWFTGGSSMTDFGKQLVPFGEAIVAFSDTVKGRVDAEAVEAAANAGKMMAEMADTIPNSGGVVGFFAGENDMDKFGKQLIPFGLAIVAFSAIVAGRVDEEAIQSAANAGKMMTEMADTIPNSGGVVSFFTGDNNMDKFGLQLVAFGLAIVAFSAIVAGHIDESAIQAAANSGKAMTEMANTIPNSGGLVSFFTGDNDMTRFGLQLVAFGAAMRLFSYEIKDIDPNLITSAAIAGKALAEMNSVIPETGGLKSFFSGDKDMGDFGEQLEAFGSGIASFSNKVKDVDSPSIDNAINSAKKLINLLKNMSGIDADSIDNFVSGMYSLGSVAVDRFINAFNERTSDATNAVNELMNAVGNAIQNGRPDTRGAIDDVLTELVTIIGEWQGDFYEASEVIPGQMGSAIEDGRLDTRGAIDDVLSELITIIGEWQGDFYNSGANLVHGFADGISDTTYAAEVASRAMAQSAIDTANHTLDEHSPSKVFRKIGQYVPEGMAIGIKSFSGKVVNATSNMAQGAIDAMSDSISNINSIVSNDMDARPTIRPVLDLSSVKAGANGISGLLGNEYSVRAIAGSIAAANGGRVNASNADVVRAINRLRGDIGNLQTNSYTIDGITYDDGSNVSNAIETLVRAATVGRRA